ncbi:hypothetical protein DET49_10333 [Salegentibacter sp. 24]|uniref:DUF7793 family protein n=1 Tax=Salegentibacter sp. 24 TaxID=2183986 RepID=UPI001061263E|nr:hypothetical protein [Salegentibacter sp. 24]TDN94967.1 hypothetical protein DET49_10333 [Salegentibacter sp. 24]
MIIKKTNNEYAETYIEQDILYFDYFKIDILTLSIAKKLLRLRLSIQNDKAYPVLCDLRLVVQADISAMDYLAKQGSELTTAVALLVNYPHSLFTAGFYLHLSEPTVPTAIFEDPLKAKAYLRKYPKSN